MVIDKLEFKCIVEKIFDDIISNYDTIKIHNQYYWDIDDNQITDIENEPKSFIVGDYFHEINHLQKLKKNKIAYGPAELQMVANILRILSI
jgi:hypothetical protein